MERRGTRRIAVAVMLAGANLVLAACLNGPQACSLIGADNGVDVRFAYGVLSGTDAFAVRACVSGVCGAERYGSGARPDRTFVTLASVPKNRDVDVSVRVSTAAQVVFDNSTRVRSHKFQPNGDGCDPVAWTVGVTARPGVLVASR